MKNAEMQVLRFDAGDVIATSLVCTHTELHFNVTSVDSTYAYGATYWWYDSDKKFGVENNDYTAELSEDFTDSTNVTTGWYYWDDSDGWIACEAGVSHSTN